MRLRVASIIVVALALLVAAPAAFAGNSTATVYGGTPGTIQPPLEQGAPPPPTTTTTTEISTPEVTSGVNEQTASGGVQEEIASGAVADEGTLPFTGLNLALIIIAGVALIGTGVLLKRRSSTS